MTPGSLPPCTTCRHFAARTWSCAAFPARSGIPEPIKLGANDHRKPYPGDGGIRYEPKSGPGGVVGGMFAGSP